MEENKKTEPVSGQAVMTVKDLRTALKTRQGILYPVDGVSLEIPKGKIIGLVGESGCGKSMMANSIMNLLPKSGDSDVCRYGDSGTGAPVLQLSP